jgi:hypothetical protein
VNTASSAFKKQYFEGNWTLNSGLVYPEFNSMDITDGGNVVTKEWEVENKFNPNNLHTIIAIDPGYVKSKFACLFCAVLPDGRLYFFDEVVKNGKGAESWDKLTPDEIADILIDMYLNKYDRLKPTQTIIDPAANDPRGGMGSLAGQLIKKGIYVSNAKKTHEYDSIMGIKNMFKNRRILINTRCQTFIKELGLFRWDERKVISGDQKPLDDDNDCADCLRFVYAAMPQPKYDAKTDYQSQFDKAYSPKNQYDNWMLGWMKEKKQKRNPLDYGV